MARSVMEPQALAELGASRTVPSIWCRGLKQGYPHCQRITLTLYYFSDPMFQFYFLLWDARNREGETPREICEMLTEPN